MLCNPKHARASAVEGAYPKNPLKDAIVRAKLANRQPTQEISSISGVELQFTSVPPTFGASFFFFIEHFNLVRGEIQLKCTDADVFPLSLVFVQARRGFGNKQ